MLIDFDISSLKIITIKDDTSEIVGVKIGHDGINV